MKGAYYNDNDPFCAEWLRRLIAAGAIPSGTVDERSIADVEPGDLRGFRHVHWFAGLGGWAYALQLAGWDMDRPVWTGSCPCQPFSSAGRQGGALDERHLWPRWLRLIRECRPDAILGEQVTGAIGFGWIDRVSADLEAEGYACGAAVLGAHSVGAPHMRQRLFWVADSQDRRPGGAQAPSRARGWGPAEFGLGSATGGVADAQRAGVWGAAREDLGAAREVQGEVGERQRLRADVGAGGGVLRERLDDADIARPQGRGLDAGEHAGPSGAGFWSDAVWLPCLDGKARRVVASLQPLAHAGECICGRRLGQLCACGEARPSRVGMLRGSGNAIAPAAAAEFVRAVLDCIP